MQRGFERVQPLLLLGGAVGLAAVVVRERDQVSDLPSMSAAPVALAGLLQLASVASAAHAWAWLTAPSERVRLVGVAYWSQLMKYLPGGNVLQVAGQISSGSSSLVSGRRAAAGWALVQALTVSTAVAACAGFALVPSIDPAVRLAVSLTPIALVVGSRAFLHRLASAVGRRWVTWPDARWLPPQADLTRAHVLVAANLVLYGTSVAVLLTPEVDRNLLYVALAAIVGWLVGFVVIPLPAGIGARELVLVALLPGAPVATIIAVGLVHRVISAVCEVGLVLQHAIRTAMAKRCRPETVKGTNQ